MASKDKKNSEEQATTSRGSDLEAFDEDKYLELLKKLEKLEKQRKAFKIDGKKTNLERSYAERKFKQPRPVRRRDGEGEAAKASGEGYDEATKASCKGCDKAACRGERCELPDW